MSNRTLLELNHDFCPMDSELADWADALRTYMRTGDPKHLPDGISFISIRHHSEPSPLLLLRQEIDGLKAIPVLCREQKCSYFQHYLAYGPADLTHEGYHAAEKHCADAQKRLSDWYAANKDNQRQEPPELRRLCERWEKAVRA